MVIKTLAIIGFVLSAYSIYISKKTNKNKNYKAFCDISEGISCTKALNSEYGSLAGFKNSTYGLFFYGIIYILALVNQNTFIFVLALASVIGSIYLAYVLYTRVKSFCIICHGIYAVNVLILIYSYLAL